MFLFPCLFVFISTFFVLLFSLFLLPFPGPVDGSWFACAAVSATPAHPTVATVSMAVNKPALLPEFLSKADETIFPKNTS